MTQNVPDGSTTGPHFQTFLLWKGTQVTLPHLPHRSPNALKHTATPLTLLIKKHSKLLGFLFNVAKGIATKMIDDMIALQTDLTLRNKLTSSLDFWSSDNTDNRDNTEAGTEIERNTTSD